MVGPARFELATYCSQSSRASQAALRPDASEYIRSGSGMRRPRPVFCSCFLLPVSCFPSSPQMRHAVVAEVAQHRHPDLAAGAEVLAAAAAGARALAVERPPARALELAAS